MAAASMSNEHLAAGIESPNRMGWILWWKSVPAISLQIAVPIGLAYWTASLAFPSVASHAHLPLAVVAAAATASFLSQRHTGSADRSAWKLAAARFFPWLLTWVFVLSATAIGFLLLIIPGMLLGTRLIWADEFALALRCNPSQAIRESWDLTRGSAQETTAFQLIHGISQTAFSVPVLLLVLGATSAVDAVGGGPVASLASSVIVSVLLVNLYASVHAGEVVYFYGLRAARVALDRDADQVNWVESAKLSIRRTLRPDLPVCGGCGAPWDPADYRADASRIYCSRCKAEVVRPTP